MKIKNYLVATLLLLANISFAQNERYSVRGEVINASTREGVPFATVVVEEQPTLGASTDENGKFEIFGVKAGIYRFGAYSLGFEPTVSPEYMVSSNSAPIELVMTESTELLDTIVVVRSLFKPVLQSPVSLRRIGLQQLEKSAGANRDLSRVVQSYPGVAFSPASYRNDLIVRGGSPSENRFYVDGFELPNINHFSTQGASGGPVGLINADLIREIELYSGAFPLSSSGALSSVLDIELRNGNPDEQNFKATVGASEVGISGSGHLSPSSDYIFSVRRSYLQLLFDALGLPFLPDFYDAQLKVRTKLSSSDYLNFLVVGALDDMSLNSDASTPTGRYILSYLPRIEQQTLTLGASYRHFSGQDSYGIYLSHSYVGDLNEKYAGNDTSSEDNLLLKLKSAQNRTLLRSENRSYRDAWRINYGAQIAATSYAVDSYNMVYSTDEGNLAKRYDEKLQLFEWGAYAGAEYIDPEERFSASAGLRLDGSNYSRRTREFWRALSPRLGFSYSLSERVAINIGSGIYYQLPPLTALSFREAGELVNRSLGYIRVWESTIGIDCNLTDQIRLSAEGFYKDYGDMLLSLERGIPLWDTGADYGSVGGEPLAGGVAGRAYGVELMARAEVIDRLSAIASLTLFRSEYKVDDTSGFRPSAWDNRYILNMSGTYRLGRNWRVGAKFSAIGGAPYTPYDVEGSSLVGVWDVNGRARLNDALHHTLRSDGYAQLDVRVDKNFYFKRWGLELYLDIQNITASKLVGPAIPFSTGEIDNASLPASEQRYGITYIDNISETVLPTVGVSIEF